MNENNFDEVVVRFPPSPTGKLHVGNVRTLVLNWLFAKKHNGRVIFRVEDTDKERSRPEHEKYMIQSFQWLGLTYDAFYRQSERTKVYKKYLEQLIFEGRAYVSKEEPSEEAKKIAEEKGKQLSTSVVRFKNPNKIVVFRDLVLGDVSVDTTDLGDFIIAKDLETPLYHLTVVVDDFLMKISHVIRGADHVSNTPRQILIQEAIGAPRPTYAHAPLVVGSDGKKLSKRHGDTATLMYKDAGYTKGAMINFLAFVGWNPGGEKEVYSIDELIKEFSLERIQKGAAVFNIEKLNWFNKKYLEKYSDQAFGEYLFEEIKKQDNFDPDRWGRLTVTLRERITHRDGFAQEHSDGEYGYMFALPRYEDFSVFVWKKSTKIATKKHLEKVLKILSSSKNKAWESGGTIKEIIWPYAEEVGRGDVLWPLRYALSGQKRSPNPFVLLFVLQKEEAILRIKNALESFGG